MNVWLFSVIASYFRINKKLLMDEGALNGVKLSYFGGELFWISDPKIING